MTEDHYLIHCPGNDFLINLVFFILLTVAYKIKFKSRRCQKTSISRKVNYFATIRNFLENVQNMKFLNEGSVHRNEKVCTYVQISNFVLFGTASSNIIKKGEIILRSINRSKLHLLQIIKHPETLRVEYPS